MAATFHLVPCALVKFKLILLGSCTLPFAIVAPRFKVTSRSPMFRNATWRFESVDVRDICTPPTGCPHWWVSLAGRDALAEERRIRKQMAWVRVRRTRFISFSLKVRSKITLDRAR